LPSRIRFRIAGRADHDLVRPQCGRRQRASTTFARMTARSDSESMLRTISFSVAGNTSTIRSMVFGGGARVQRAEHEMAGFSCGGGARDEIVSRSRIFTDEDYVGGLRAMPSAALR